MVVSRSEKDMVEIKQAYMEEFGKSLAHDIKVRDLRIRQGCCSPDMSHCRVYHQGDCAGDFKKILLALIGEA